MIRSLSVIILVILGFSLSGHAQQKRALIICVGEQLDKSWGNINAENDLLYVQKLLNYCGYNDISNIRGRDATKQGIVNKFDEFTHRCTKGDIIYIHFSGHGQRMTDINGDEQRIRDKDRYDESWIPYDAYMTYCEQDKGEKHLSDDEVAQLLSKIKTKIGSEGNILVVVDACHSGGSTRGPDDLYMGLCTRGAEKYFEIPTSNYALTSKSDITEEWLTLSACADYQVNVECVSPKVGKLTYILYELRRSIHKMSNDEFRRAVSNMMNSPEFKAPLRQDPVLSEYKCDIKRFFQK